MAARKAADADESSRPRLGAILSTISLADIGYATGFRFANLGGRRDLFVSLPAGADVTARELVLTVGKSTIDVVVPAKLNLGRLKLSSFNNRSRFSPSSTYKTISS